jgi:hypothetical protein
MDALTPGRAALRPDRSAMNTGWPRSGLPDSCTRPSRRSVANHLTRPSIALTRYPSACWASDRSRRSLVFPSTRGGSVWASPFGSWLAPTPGRIAFVILRTDGSPPVASDPASRRRPYLQLQAGERMPEGDLHPSDRVHSQAHYRRHRACSADVSIRARPATASDGRRGPPYRQRFTTSVGRQGVAAKLVGRHGGRPLQLRERWGAHPRLRKELGTCDSTSETSRHPTAATGGGRYRSRQGRGVRHAYLRSA